MELAYCGSECFLPLETLYLRDHRRRSACRRTDAILLQLQNRIQWALNSAVECHPHTVEVVGSNPTAPTISLAVDRLVDRKSQVAGNILSRSRSIPGANELHGSNWGRFGYQAANNLGTARFRAVRRESGRPREGGSGRSQVLRNRKTQGALA